MRTSRFPPFILRSFAHRRASSQLLALLPPKIAPDLVRMAA